VANRTKEIRIRLTPEEKHDLEILRDATGAPISVIVRAFVFTYIRDVARGQGSETISLLDALGLLPKVPKIVSEEEAAANAAADE
jgi:hypothetical protein